MKRFYAMMLVGLVVNFSLEHWSIGPEWVAKLALGIALYGLAMSLFWDFAYAARGGWIKAQDEHEKRRAEEIAEKMSAHLSEMLEDMFGAEDRCNCARCEPKREINPEGVKH